MSGHKSRKKIFQKVDHFATVSPTARRDRPTYAHKFNFCVSARFLRIRTADVRFVFPMSGSIHPKMFFFYK